MSPSWSYKHSSVLDIGNGCHQYFPLIFNKSKPVAFRCIDSPHRSPRLVAQCKWHSLISDILSIRRRRHTVINIVNHIFCVNFWSVGHELYCKFGINLPKLEKLSHKFVIHLISLHRRLLLFPIINWSSPLVIITAILTFVLNMKWNRTACNNRKRNAR